MVQLRSTVVRLDVIALPWVDVSMIWPARIRKKSGSRFDWGFGYQVQLYNTIGELKETWWQVRRARNEVRVLLRSLPS